MCEHRVAVLLVSLLVAGLGLYQLIDVAIGELKPRSREVIEETLVDTAYLAAGFLAEQWTGERIDTAPFERAFAQLSAARIGAQVYELKKESVDIRISVTDAKGIVLYDSFNPRNVGKDFSSWNDVLRTLRGEYGARTTRDNPDDPASTVLYVAAPIIRNASIVGSVSVAKPTRSSNYFIEIAKRRLVRESALTLTVLLILAWLLSALVSRPIARLTRYARDIRDGSPSALPRLGSGEVHELGQAFEEMRVALEGKKSIERYVQTLTHELKSPLAAIRGAAELLEEADMPADRRVQFLENIRGETTRIQNLIERLLELASLEARVGLEQRVECDLAGLTREVVHSFGPRLERKRLMVRWSGTPHGTTTGDPFLIRQAINNVLDNAVKYSPDAGVIQITVEGGMVRIEDSGSGIPDYALSKVTERFFSLPRSSSGKKSSGLGLSFVAEVLKLHGGEVTVQNSTSGGASITLRFR